MASKTLRVSEVSAASPDMPVAEFEAFVEDIRKHGQLIPIVKCGNEVIDGRKRLEACRRLGIEVRFVDVSTNQDPVALSRSLNILRTQYSHGQRAMFAAKVATATKGEGPRRRGSKDRPIGRSLRTVAEAAAQTSVATSKVTLAKAIRRDAAPEVVAAVEAGTLSLHAAEKIRKQVPKAEQSAVVTKVIEASKGKKRQTPVAAVLGKKNGMKRSPKRPPGWRAERALDQLDNALDCMEELFAEEAQPPREWTEHLRSARTRITRMVRERS